MLFFQFNISPNISMINKLKSSLSLYLAIHIFIFIFILMENFQLLLESIVEMYSNADCSVDWSQWVLNRPEHTYDFSPKDLEQARGFSYFNIETQSNEVQPTSTKYFAKDKLTIGSHYVPLYHKNIDSSNPKYKELLDIFNRYYKVRHFIGNRSLILDNTRFEYLLKNYMELKNANPDQYLELRKLFQLYTASFDTAWLGENTSKTYTCSGVIKNIEIVSMGEKYAGLVGNVTVDQYKVYSAILDKTDADYDNHVKNYNESQETLKRAMVDLDNERSHVRKKLKI